MKTDLFDTIFADAVVIDHDMSYWYHELVLCVIGCDVALGPDGMPRTAVLPLFLVGFQRVLRTEWAFADYERLDSGTIESYTWRIRKAERQEHGDGTRVKFNHGLGSYGMPTMLIECLSIEIRRVAPRDLSRHFPNWNRPGGPLIRPGLKASLQV